HRSIARGRLSHDRPARYTRARGGWREWDRAGSALVGPRNARWHHARLESARPERTRAARGGSQRRARRLRVSAGPACACENLRSSSLARDASPRALATRQRRRRSTIVALAAAGVTTP